MSKRQNPQRLTTLARHLENQLRNELTLQQFYENKLSELQGQRSKLDGLGIGQQQFQNTSLMLSQQLKGDRGDCEKSLMGKSKVSIMLGNNSKIDMNKSKHERSISRKQPVTYETEYQSTVEQLMKVMDAIVAKEQNYINRKDFQRTNKSSSFMNKSMRGSKIIQPKKEKGFSLGAKMKTDRSYVQPSKQEQIAIDLTDASVLNCDDEILNNLLKHLKDQEQRYTTNLFAQTELSVKAKMKTYMSRQCEKYEETIFKLRQEELQKTESQVQCNKETVRRGYTDQMKKAVERGLRSSGR